MAEALLVSGLRAGYGATEVLEDVSFALEPGTALSVIGRNGVGKTTLLATLMGLATRHAGAIALGGRDLSALPPNRRALAGLGYVPQRREIFPSLTVQENLRIGARPGPWSAERIEGLFPVLAERGANRGDQLSGGEQQMLAVGRALATNPSVLLLDEPFEGLAPVVVRRLHAALTAVRDETGLSIILVEQHAKLALGFAPRVLVMNRGRVVYDGASAALSADPAWLDRLCGIGTG